MTAVPPAVEPAPKPLHPDFPGEPSVRELLAGFWPFTRGRRVTLLWLNLVSLTLFALSATVPIQVGSLLSTALVRRQDESSLQTYVIDPIHTKASALASLGSTSPEQTQIAGLAIDAVEAQGLIDAAPMLLGKLFPDGHRYTTTHLQLVDEPSQPWEQLVAATGADGYIERAELAQLADRASTEPAAGRAFAFLTSSLLTEKGARADRTSWHDRAFQLLLVRFGLTVLAIFGLRLLAIRLTQRSVLFAARKLQDKVFVAVHDTALVDAGALARSSMVSRCTSYIDRCSNSVTKFLTAGVPDAAALVLSIGVLTWIDPWIGLLTVGVVLAFEGGRRLLSPRWAHAAHERLDLNTLLGETTDMAITDGRSIRAARAESPVRGVFADRAELVMRNTRRLEMFGELFHLSSFAFGQFAVLTTIALVGFVRRDLTLAEAAAVVLYVKEVTQAIDGIPALIIDMQEAAPSMRRLRRVLAAPIRGARTWPLPAADTSSVVSFSGTSIATPLGATLVDRLDVEFNPGWTFLVGERTLTVAVLDLAAGLEVPDHGTISVGGQVAYIPSEPLVLEGTLRANLTGFAEWSITDDALLEVARRWGLDRHLPLTSLDGLEVPVGQPRRPIPDEVRARIGFARVEAMLRARNTPAIVLIDDPTHHLARTSAEELWSTARTAFEGSCVLVTTEQLTVIDPDDRVVTFARGASHEDGTRGRLLADGRQFARMWRHYVEGGALLAYLGELPELSSLDATTLAMLPGRLLTEHFLEGDQLADAGSPADRLFIVVDGRVALINGSTQVATLGPGQQFGGFSGNHTLTAMAVTDTVVRSLHRHALSAGVSGVLDLDETQRLVFSHLARGGEQAAQTLANASGVTLDMVEDALRTLVANGTVVSVLSDEAADGATPTFRVASALTHRATSVTGRRLLDRISAS